MNKKIALAAVSLAATAWIPSASSAEPSPEGCVAAAGQTSGPGLLGEDGSVNGIVGVGVWRVERERLLDDGTIETVIYKSPADGTPVAMTNLFRAGDALRCTAPQGAVIAGRV